MTVLTAEQATNLYLYGTLTAPADRVTPMWIGKPAQETRITVNVNDYMSDTGPGRFASAASFEVVRKFFSFKL